MTETEHMLVCLMEEAAEVQLACTEVQQASGRLQQECSKALRFGLNHAFPAVDPPNREKIRAEFNDLCGVVALLRERGVLPPRDETDVAAVHAKTQKLRAMMEYAHSQGTLLSQSSKEPTR